MAVTQGSTDVQQLSDQLAEQLRSSGAARASFGSKDAAFAWAGGAMPRGVHSFVNTVSVEGSGFNAVIVAPSATPPAVVPPGGLKPVAVDISTANHPLQKFAGQGTFRAESAWYSDVLAGAVVATLVNGSLLALEGHSLGVLNSSAGLTQSGDASWPAAILGAIGQVAGNGGNPNLLVISPADFAKAVESPSQLSFLGTDAIPTFLGLALHLSPKAVAGTAYVLDSSAFTVAESVASPSVVLDAYSKAVTNEITVVADVMAVSVANAPGLIAEVTPTIVPLAAAARK